MILLAGGSGTRMGNTAVPKQFLELKGKPIIIYSIENALKCKLIDKIIIACNSQYVDMLKKMVSKYKLSDSVHITNGGTNRLLSTCNGISYIIKNFGITQKDIFIAHDSVRIFTNERIFRENIQNANIYGAATTVYALEETIVKAGADGLLYKAYARENRFSGQSPQTFNLQKFIINFSMLSTEQKNTFTDLSEVFFANNEKVFPVIGDKENIKITTPFDLILAEKRLANKKQED